MVKPLPRRLWIRRALPQDEAFLHDIEHAAFPTGTAYTAEELAEALGRCRTWVAVEEGPPERVVGFLAIESAEPNIEDIAILPSHQGRGLTRRLLAEAEASLRRNGIQSLRLQVAVRNSTAVAAFERLGFVRQRVLSGYYTSPAWAGDALEMEKSL